MPFFSMVRRPRVETRRDTQRRSASIQKRWVCRFGRKRRRFLLLAWETRLPTATLLPVTSQTRLIKVPKFSELTNRRPGFRASKGPPLYQRARRGATWEFSPCPMRPPDRQGDGSGHKIGVARMGYQRVLSVALAALLLAGCSFPQSDRETNSLIVAFSVRASPFPQTTNNGCHPRSGDPARVCPRARAHRAAFV